MALTASEILDTDSEDELPPGWEERVTIEGKVYYANHELKATQWVHPSSGKKKQVTGELPYGWERKVMDDGNIVYIEYVNLHGLRERQNFTDCMRDSRYLIMSSAQEDVPRNPPFLSINKLKLTWLSWHVGTVCFPGFETARSLALHGATVTLACRDLGSAERCRKRIIAEHQQATVHTLHLDLASLRSVQNFVEEYKKLQWPLHMLILNAAVFGLPHTLTEDDLEMTFQVNHLSHFYLTSLLEDVLLASAPARVVVVSSESHRFTDLSVDNLCETKLSPSAGKHSDLRAYNLSKLCNVLFSNELHTRLGTRGVTANSLHPGNMMSSNISRNWWLYRLLFTLVRPFTKSMQQGAATTVYCATSQQLEGLGGMYFNNCCRCKPSDAAHDSKLATTLWDLSETIIRNRLSRS
ncbi:WW domain-containing oxidoreductase-like [Gigantopelta aegis]|uniref:WW domain-containing oxidoreductase-like n=1 Tax=Gigantopelta aegis TaxID=1735272 RepID=UPI001B88E605|nr:WW domain-containing oxidoreductase-like [Gigantopelta aegis]